MREQTIRVPGVHCDHCKMSIEGALQAVPGVQSAQVDVPDKQVTVAYDERSVGLDRIRTAIEDQGYDVPA